MCADSSARVSPGVESLIATRSRGLDVADDTSSFIRRRLSQNLCYADFQPAKRLSSPGSR
jgi:hypothetical protein